MCSAGGHFGTFWGQFWDMFLWFPRIIQCFLIRFSKILMIVFLGHFSRYVSLIFEISLTFLWISLSIFTQSMTIIQSKKPENHLWHVSFSLGTFWVTLGSMLGMFLDVFRNSEYFPMALCTELIRNSLMVTKQNIYLCQHLIETSLSVLILFGVC